jgi:hypothetical protein
MKYRSRRGHSVPEPLWRRIDRVAGEINPFLLVLAIGLVLLYLTSVVGLLIKFPITRIDPAACAKSSQATGKMAAGAMYTVN